MPLPLDAKALVAIFGVSGVLHLAKPETYEPLMPSFVPAHREVIYASGVAELLCAAGLLHPRTRKLAGYGIDFQALIKALQAQNAVSASGVVQAGPE
ncbi:DoxX family protein, partial [Xanthobacter autotrophicus]